MVVVHTGSCELVGPLAWELPYVTSAALKSQKKKKRKTKGKIECTRHPARLMVSLSVPFRLSDLPPVAQAQGGVGGIHLARLFQALFPLNQVTAATS